MNSTAKWILKKRPLGSLSVDTFEKVIEELSPVAKGQVLVKLVAFANAPAMREWMDEDPGSAPPIELGEAVRCLGVAEVVRSENPSYVAGERLSGMFGWEEYALIDPDETWDESARAWAGSRRYTKVDASTSPAHLLGVLGLNGMAAYFGMVKVARPKCGETVVVSAAAGSTGSIAGQIARNAGARVIGISSGKQKVKALTEILGFDLGLDRKSDSFIDDLELACPQGIDVYFDNVQGEILDICLSHLAKFGRIVMCGGVSVSSSSNGRAEYNLMQVVWKRATLQGFSVFEYSEADRDDAYGQLKSWLEEDRLKVLTDDRQGFDVLPEALIDLLEGRSLGRQIVWV